ncbi:unnamed protein product [Closterium sp. Yama58-4]|nr:unnamed protein product [Closterium sp. Yama58-4]
MTSFPSVEAVFSRTAIPPDFIPWLFESVAAVALAVSQLPPLVWWLLLAVLAALLLVFLYNWFDLHVVSHVFVGDRVKVVHNPGSNVARAVFARMRIPHFWPTPWLCSPHLQTTFVHFFAPTPHVPYIRHVVRTPDGGTLGLDWAEPAASGVTRHGWRALVPNHRGLGGVTITSNRFYNAGWTTDLRFVISLVQQDYPHAPLYAIGTSLGANILVKYLGEEGASGPIQAAVSIGNPWDLLICDRWMNRRTRQRVYNTAMVTGLRDFAKLHKDSFRHLVDVQHVMKARTIRQFDDRITRIVSNYETVDTYYRRCGSAQFLPEVAVPLLAVSALDDPICTREAIPWDEAKANPNVVLAVSHHGGHLAYLQGLTASSIWWVCGQGVGLTASSIWWVCGQGVVRVAWCACVGGGGVRLGASSVAPWGAFGICRESPYPAPLSASSSSSQPPLLSPLVPGYQPTTSPHLTSPLPFAVYSQLLPFFFILSYSASLPLTGLLLPHPPSSLLLPCFPFSSSRVPIVDMHQ